MAVTVILFSGCDEVKGIFGTITFVTMDTVPSNVYVILDTDTDPDNGSVKRVNINISSSTSSVPYFLDTTDVAAGTYYLLGAWDYAKESNIIDPDSMAHWDAHAWYGDSGSVPPGSENITNMNAQYDIVLIDGGT